MPNFCEYPGSHNGRITFNRLEQGRFAASQIVFKGFMILSFFVCWLWSSLPPYRSPESLEALQKDNSILTVISRRGAELIQDDFLL
jgi:hypothetical protein